MVLAQSSGQKRLLFSTYNCPEKKESSRKTYYNDDDRINAIEIARRRTTGSHAAAKRNFAAEKIVPA